MNTFTLKRHILWIYFFGLVAFVLNKFMIRPWLIEHNFSELLLLLAYSFPNFLEAICGTLNIAGLLYLLRWRLRNTLDWLNDLSLYTTATILAAIFVITQEMKFHNLGGRNVYDPNDVIASIIGLLFSWWLLIQFGIMKKKLQEV